jgi:uncharacterized membrane protein
MSEENPYQAPESNVEQAVEIGGLTEPQSVPAGRGVGWITDGFGLFKMAPGIWIANIVIFFVIVMVLSFIPIVSLVLNLFMPVFTAGFMLGCRDLDEGNDLQISHLFAGFQNRTGALVAVGALYLVMIIIVMGVAFGGMFMAGGGTAMMENPEAMQNGAMPTAMLLAVLIGTALMIPVVMAYWFAPALIVFNEELGVIEAMKMSFMGCLKNIIPFLLYGIVAMVLAVVASIPLMLGWLVLGPMLIGSMYVAYKEIFTE